VNDVIMFYDVDAFYMMLLKLGVVSDSDKYCLDYNAFIEDMLGRPPIYPQYDFGTSQCALNFPPWCQK
jgi:hypothetical protein